MVSKDNWEDEGVIEFDMMDLCVDKVGCYKILWVVVLDLNYFVLVRLSFLV